MLEHSAHYKKTTEGVPKVLFLGYIICTNAEVLERNSVNYICGVLKDIEWRLMHLHLKPLPDGLCLKSILTTAETLQQCHLHGATGRRSHTK